MEEAPTEGGWYETDTGEVFMVAATNGANGVIDVQYLNGRVDQWERAIWSDLDLTQIEPPEDWRADMDTFFRERGRRR